MGAVVVVGHGPSLEGKALGALIDAHPVVRMWNNHWQSVDDYGKRYDYGLFCPPLGEHSTVPSQCWWAYHVNQTPLHVVGSQPELIDGVAVKVLWYTPWTDRAIAMGGKAEGRRFKLTRGCVAVCAAIESLKPKTLILAGLDMMRSGRTVSPRYGAAAQVDFDVAMAGHEHVFKPAGHAREGAHDLAVESKMIAAMAAENGTDLVWLW